MANRRPAWGKLGESLGGAVGQDTCSRDVAIGVSVRVPQWRVLFNCGPGKEPEEGGSFGIGYLRWQHGVVGGV